MNQAIRNVPIGIKVAIAPALAIVLMLALGAVSWFSNAGLTSSLTAVGDVALPRVVRRVGDS